MDRLCLPTWQRTLRPPYSAEHYQRPELVFLQRRRKNQGCPCWRTHWQKVVMRQIFNIEIWRVIRGTFSPQSGCLDRIWVAQNEDSQIRRMVCGQSYFHAIKSHENVKKDARTSGHPRRFQWTWPIFGQSSNNKNGRNPPEIHPSSHATAWWLSW
jgi:hypothetical protein